MISVVPHKFHRIEVVVVARKESQPAVQAASCAAASRLYRHSAQTHTPYNASVLPRVSVLFLFRALSATRLFWSWTMRIGEHVQQTALKGCLGSTQHLIV